MSAATHPSSSLAPSPNITMGSIDALSNGMHTDEPVELILLGTGTSSTRPHTLILLSPGRRLRRGSVLPLGGFWSPEGA